MKKIVSTLFAILALVAWIAIFMNSFAQFERRTAAAEYQWRLSWADRR